MRCGMGVAQTYDELSRKCIGERVGFVYFSCHLCFGFTGEAYCTGYKREDADDES